MNFLEATVDVEGMFGKLEFDLELVVRDIEGPAVGPADLLGNIEVGIGGLEVRDGNDRIGSRAFLRRRSVMLSVDM